jgi:hypothetical protein
MTVLVDQCCQAFDCMQTALDCLTTLRSLGSGGRIGFEPTLGLLETTLEERLTLEQASISHFEIASAARQQ